MKMELMIFAIGAIFAIIGYLIKQNVSLVLTQAQENKAAIARLSGELGVVKNDLNELHIYIANNYVPQDDFLREIVRYESLLKLVMGAKGNDESR